MKLLNLLGISFAVTLYCFNEVNATAEAVKEERATKIELFENFRTSKNIMFSCMFGGASHVNWVISILKELSDRGHSTSFLTRENQVNFTEDYPTIKTLSVGPAYKDDLTKMKMNDTEAMKDITMCSILAFKDDYTAIRNFILSNNVDVAICDQFNFACVEASLNTKIPFVITGTFPLGEDASAPFINNMFYNMHIPTTEDLSLKERLHDKFIESFKFDFVLREILRLRKQTHISLGLPPPQNVEAHWKNSLKLINTAFGFEPARNIGPLMELIGPILPRTYSSLNSELKVFLSNRSKVAYVAFGQHAILTESDGRLLMTALLESLEAKVIDGAIWATRGLTDIFPNYITTSSNTTYDINSFSDSEKKSSNIMFVEWAPQMAVLQDPSTSFFITHGGAGSIYEAMYAGKRLVVYPFFGDQPGAAINTEKNGIGLKLGREFTQEKANEVVNRVAKDDNNIMQSNVKIFKALTQIRSKHGSLRGADAVEEVLFTHNQDSEIPHRYPASRKMSFMKANNFDLYLFLLGSMVCIGYTAYTFFNYFATMVPTSKIKIH